MTSRSEPVAQSVYSVLTANRGTVENIDTHVQVRPSTKELP
nr:MULTISPECIES: hypothetical protein [unclassified Rhodococcus (in: high G+C Gram-positive bacteria)]